jgi:hypothetical protein
MQSARFGVAWIVHQTVPRLLSESASQAVPRLLSESASQAVPRNQVTHDDASIESALIVAQALGSVMPCRYCRESYREFSRAAHLYEQLEMPSASNGLQRTDHERYWASVHNMVNAKLHKPVINLNDSAVLRRAYETSVAATPCAFVDALLEWLQLLSLNFNNSETGQSPIVTPEQVAAVRRMRRSASSPANAGYFLREARRRAVPLSAVIEAYALERKPDGISDAEWLKVVWYIFYMAHLVAIMQRSGIDRLQQCGTRLATALELDSAKRDKKKQFGRRKKTASSQKDPFDGTDSLFEALRSARQDCLPTTCQSTTAADRATYEQYRAKKCSSGTCV